MKLLLFIFISISGCFISKYCCSQNTYEYTFGYDDSGNRTSRTAIQLRSAKLPSDSLNNVKAQEVKETLAGKQLIIYPNPTKGRITVEMPLSEGDVARITLFDVQGKTLTDLKNIGPTTELDLSGQPAGVYLMRIIINSKATTWKIIKQD